MSKLHLSRIVLAAAAAFILGLGCGSPEVTSEGPPKSGGPADTQDTPAGGDQGTPADGDDVAMGGGDQPAGADACTALDADTCRTTEGCQTVRAAHVMALPAAQGAAPAHCLKPRSEVACIPAQMCAEALTYFCNDKGEVFEVSNACGPAGWKQCEAPQQLQGACAE